MGDPAMPYRSVLFAACIVAGTWLLTGAGVALLVAAPMALVVGRGLTVPAGAVAAYRRASSAVRSSWRKAVKLPRRALAATAMTGGLVTVPTGIALVTSVGAALAVAGALTVALSLLLGWVP